MELPVGSIEKIVHIAPRFICIRLSFSPSASYITVNSAEKDVKQQSTGMYNKLTFQGYPEDIS